MAKTDSEYAREHAIQQFVERARAADLEPKVDNAKLYAGEPMYFYCKHCGVLADKVQEGYIFATRDECSQCQGMREHGWLDAAKKAISEASHATGRVADAENLGLAQRTVRPG